MSFANAVVEFCIISWLQILMFNFVLVVFFLVYLCYFGTELSFAIIIDLFIEDPCIKA